MELDDLILKLKSVMNIWHEGTRHGNDGNQGNTLEYLLGVPENNIPLPDLGGIFELKTQKKESSALITLLHSEPTTPQTPVPKLCIALGWPHQKRVEKNYPDNEMSFRSTTYGHGYSDRGFRIQADSERLNFIFSPNHVAVHKEDKSGAYETYGDWLDSLESRSIHYSEILPVEYNIHDLSRKIKAKLDNTIFVLCKTQTDKSTGKKYFYYDEAYIFKGFREDRLINLFNDGDLFLDFDARTNHNHGTKVRVKKDKLKYLFEKHIELD